jgi:hypothetical protein
MFMHKSRHLTITILTVVAVLVATVAATPAAAGPPGGATPVGSPVYVSHANGQVDQLQLFTGQSIYPNTPGADLWYLPQGGTTWIEVECCVPVDVAPTVLAAESAGGGIDAFVVAPGGVSVAPAFTHAHQVGPGGSWQLEALGNIMKGGFGGGGTPQLSKAADGRLHFFAFDASWQVAHFGQTTPAGPWTGWQLLGPGPFAMPVTMISATVSESTDGTLNLTSPMVGAPPSCTATTRLAPGQSTWSGWQVDPTAPAYCPRQPH